MRSRRAPVRSAPPLNCGVMRHIMLSAWASSAIFVAAYIGCVGVAMWINNPVLCLGDPKFGNGCGGFSLYYPFWTLSFSPLVVVALVVARPTQLHGYRVRGLLLSVCLLLIVSAVEVSFVFDIGLPVLLAEYVLLGALFFFLRSLALSQSGYRRGSKRPVAER